MVTLWLIHLICLLTYQIHLILLLPPLTLMRRMSPLGKLELPYGDLHDQRRDPQDSKTFCSFATSIGNSRCTRYPMHDYLSYKRLSTSHTDYLDKICHLWTIQLSLGQSKPWMGPDHEWRACYSWILRGLKPNWWPKVTPRWKTLIIQKLSLLLQRLFLLELSLLWHSLKIGQRTKWMLVIHSCMVASVRRFLWIHLLACFSRETKRHSNSKNPSMASNRPIGIGIKNLSLHWWPLVILNHTLWLLYLSFRGHHHFLYLSVDLCGWLGHFRGLWRWLLVP